MKKEANDFLDKTLEDNGIELYQEIRAIKLKQSNNKPVYLFQMKFSDFRLSMYVFQNKENKWLVNHLEKGISDQSSFVKEELFDQIEISKKNYKKLKLFKEKPIRHESNNDEIISRKDRAISRAMKKKF